jgi:hypothetical protein
MTKAQRFETRWERAAGRAIKDGLRFRRATNGVDFEVVSPNDTYHVKIKSLTTLTATCECRGAADGHLCKHVAGVFMLIGLVNRNGDRVA